MWVRIQCKLLDTLCKLHCTRDDRIASRARARGARARDPAGPCTQVDRDLQRASVVVGDGGPGPPAELLAAVADASRPAGAGAKHEAATRTERARFYAASYWAPYVISQHVIKVSDAEVLTVLSLELLVDPTCAGAPRDELDVPAILQRTLDAVGKARAPFIVVFLVVVAVAGEQGEHARWLEGFAQLRWY